MWGWLFPTGSQREVRRGISVACNSALVLSDFANVVNGIAFKEREKRRGGG